MTKHRALSLCALAICAGIAVVAFALRARHVDLPPIDPAAPSSASAKPPAVLDARSDAAIDALSAAADASAAARTSAIDPRDSSAALLATLVVRTVSRASGKPVARARVRLDGMYAARELDARGAFVRSTYTDDEGRAEFALESGVSGSLSVADRSPNAAAETHEVTALGPNERREVVLELDERTLSGTVVRCDDGTAIRDARVRACVLTASRRVMSEEPEELVLCATTTDASGRFSLRLPPSKEPYLRVDTPGFSGVRVELSAPVATADESYALCLDPTATLKVEIVDARGAPLVGRVEVVRHEADAYGSGHVAIAPTLGDAGELTCETNESGLGRIDGVPAHLLLRVRATWRGEAYRSADRYLALQPGEVRTLRWTFGGGCRVEGRVVDGDGRPVAWTTVVLQRRASEHAHVLRYTNSNAGMTQTDADGRFDLGEISSGAWWIGAVHTGGRDGDASDPSIGLPESLDISASDTSRFVQLRLERGLFIAGHVLTPDGEPAPGYTIEAQAKSGRCRARATSTDDGSVRIGPLVAGSYELRMDFGWLDPAITARMDRAFSRPEDVRSDTAPFACALPITADAGASDVKFQLRRSLRVTGSVRDAREDRPCDARVCVIERTGGAARPRFVATQEGRFELAVEPGIYDILASTADMKFGRATRVHVESSDAPAEVTIEVEPGALLRVHCEAPREGGPCRVLREGEIVACGVLGPNGELLCIVPAGPCTVILDEESEPAPLERRVDLRVGARALVEFGRER